MDVQPIPCRRAPPGPLAQGGRILFQGPPKAAVAYFARHGFPCPPLTNPADHVMEVISGGAGGSPLDSARSGTEGGGMGPRTCSAASLQLQEPPVIE